MKTLILILTLTLPILTYAQDSASFEYLSITQAGGKLGITHGTEKFEAIDVKQEKDKDFYDLRPLLKRVEQFESEGWEVFSSNQFNSSGTGSLPTMHFLLRRKKK